MAETQYWCRRCGRKKARSSFFLANKGLSKRRPVKPNCIRCTVQMLERRVDRNTFATLQDLKNHLRKAAR